MADGAQFALFLADMGQYPVEFVETVVADLDFALQMYESAVNYDPEFALAYGAIAMTCARYYYRYGHAKVWADRSEVASARASELEPGLPEVELARAWMLFANNEAAAALPLTRLPSCQSLLRVSSDSASSAVKKKPPASWSSK